MIYEESPFHSINVGVSSPISQNYIVVLIFHYKTIDGEFYAKIIQNFIALFEKEEWDVWLQRDGTLPMSSKIQ